jgi:hypothetical protein
MVLVIKSAVGTLHLIGGVPFPRINFPPKRSDSDRAFLHSHIPISSAPQLLNSSRSRELNLLTIRRNHTTR